jgi:hypothetical protein
MLKYLCGIILSVAILAGVCASPAHAASASLVMTQIQAGGVGAALEEMVILFNNSDDEADITNWCLKNKANIQFVCFEPSTPNVRLILPSRQYATIASHALTTTINFSDFTQLYTSVNHSSGALVGSSEYVSLLDASGQTIDAHSWGTSLVGGMLFERQIVADYPTVYADTDQPSDWSIQSPQFIPASGVEYREAELDACTNLEGIQPAIPDGYEDVAGLCLLPAPTLFLTELLPDADGKDTGNEFIEIFNPHNEPIDLSRYELWVNEEPYAFPEGTVIAAQAYLAFTDTQIGFTLPNSTALVMIKSGDRVVDSISPYDAPEENEAWAYVNDLWQYTNQPTPGAINAAWVEVSPSAEGEESQSSALKPCAPNQYRHPDTNRCRLVGSESSTPTPCDADQERNPETGRCRKIATTTEPTPCKEGQERNPETNRCRTVKTMTEVDHGVLGATQSADRSSYVWLAVAALVALALAYAVWEWRYEIVKRWRYLRQLVAPKK